GVHTLSNTFSFYCHHDHQDLPSFPTRRSSDLSDVLAGSAAEKAGIERGDVIREVDGVRINQSSDLPPMIGAKAPGSRVKVTVWRSEEHTSELQSRENLVCRLLLEKKKRKESLKLALLITEVLLRQLRRGET